jgi:hypothetical protein
VGQEGARVFDPVGAGRLATITAVPTTQDIVFRVALAIPHGTGVEDLVAPQIFIGLVSRTLEKKREWIVVVM